MMNREWTQSIYVLIQKSERELWFFATIEGIPLGGIGSTVSMAWKKWFFLIE